MLLQQIEVTSEQAAAAELEKAFGAAIAAKAAPNAGRQDHGTCGCGRLSSRHARS